MLLELLADFSLERFIPKLKNKFAVYEGMSNFI